MSLTKITLSTYITPELLAEMEENERKLEALKETDPAEYKRIMEPREKLCRYLHIVREHNRK